MNDTRLEQIRERCNRATEGPWISFVEDRDHTCGSNFIKTSENDIELIEATVDDQDFIANARQDILWLISEVCRLNGLLNNIAACDGNFSDS